MWEKKEWELDEVVYQNGGRLVTLTKGPNITLRFFLFHSGATPPRDDISMRT